MDGLHPRPRQGGVDLDEMTEAALEMPPRPAALYDLCALGQIVQRPELLPPGMEVVPTGGGKDWAWRQPNLSNPVRVTTDPTYFEEHADSIRVVVAGKFIIS